MSLFDDIKNAISAVENFGQHLPVEVQPAFGGAVGDLKAAADAAAQAGVAVGETEIATIPVLGPELAPLFGLWADSLIEKLQAAKAAVAKPA